MSTRSLARLAALALIMGLGVPAATAQKTIRTDDDAPLGGDGTSWATAHKHLQDALAAAVSGDEILVAGGVYRPDRDEVGGVAPGDRTATFQLISGVDVTGGYRGLAGGGDGDDRDPALFESILSGDLDEDDDSGGDNAENSYQIVTGSGTDASALLDGFTITAGNADGPDDFPLFKDRGGGMFIAAGSPTVRNCVFSNNIAALGGGGLNNEESSPTLINCVFRGNAAGFSGGGMRAWVSGPTLINCVFSGNAAESGGAAWHGASTAAYVNCTFSANSAPLGNALGFDSCCPVRPSNVALTNCVLWDGGNEIRNFDDSTISVTHSDVQDADPNDTAIHPGVGNIDDDPLFVDAAGTDNTPGTGDDDLHLSAGSPCIDTGDNAVVTVSTDLDGNARIADGDGDTVAVIDMGAYEHHREAAIPAISTWGLIVLTLLGLTIGTLQLPRSRKPTLAA